MGIYYESLEKFLQKGGLKQSTITAKQLLPAIVAHMVRMDRKFTLTINGRTPKPVNEMLEEVFDLCHLQQPFYTQHCATRNSRYMSVSKNRIKIDFSFTYRMPRSDEKWVLNEMKKVLQIIIKPHMTELEKVVVVHDYIVRNYQYEMNTTGSPFTVLTFMKEGKGVCMAYALLFEKMVELINIPAYYVVGQAIGESGLGHAWNMVQLDGEWYHIDATWNDLGSRSDKYAIRYRYFLKTDDFMKQDHTWNTNHYPACNSTKYEALQSIYDAAYLNGALYYPNKKGFLTKLSLSDLKIEQLLPLKVQHCVTVNDLIYFSNYSDEGSLYSFNPVLKERSLISNKYVKAIHQKIEETIIVYEKEEEIIKVADDIFESSPNDQPQLRTNLTVPFIHFDDTWMGTYDGEASTITFVDEEGLSLIILEPLSQATITLFLTEKVIDICISSKRKPVLCKELMYLNIPKKYIKENASFKNEFGETVEFVMRDEFLEFKLTKSIKLIAQ